MRVLVCSHVRLFGESLVRCLAAIGGVERAAFYPSAAGRAAELVELSPDLALLDIGADGVIDDAIAVSRSCPRARLLALSLPESPDQVIACADAGFDGYLSRESSLEELWTAMLRALRGECTCPPQIAGSLMREVRRRRSAPSREAESEPLTLRESEILGLVAQGMSNKELAVRLRLSVATVKNHLYNAFRKLRVKRRLEALAKLRAEPWLIQPTLGERQPWHATGSD